MPVNALLVALVVWIILLFQFVRAVRSKRLKGGPSWKMWAILMCGALAFTLRGESGDLEISIPPYRLLIGGYAKFFGLLGAFYLYFLVLKETLPKKFDHRRWLDYLAPAAMGCGVIFFAVVANTETSPLSREDVHLATAGFRDAIIMIYTLAVFIPGNILMFPYEKVPAMRMKHIAGLIFFFSLIGVCIGNILAFLAFGLELSAPAFPRNSNPFTFICVLAFTVLLLPHRALTILYYPFRLRVWHKIWGLDCQIGSETKVPSLTPRPTLRLLLPRELELAIYLSTISILDRYRHLEFVSPHHPIYRQMVSLMASDPDYPVLVERLAEIKMNPVSDPVPDNSNRIASLLGRIFHPAVVAVPTQLIVLSELGWDEALRWSLLVLPIVLIPGLVTLFFLERRGRMAYQRPTRTPLYIVAWFSVIVCLVLVIALQGPRVLFACLGSLAVWLPLQLTINTYITKVSAHTAVAAGCYTGLLLLGKLDSWELKVGLLLIVLAVVWARVVTRNHTPTQVLTGLVVGVLPVLVIFQLVLNGG